ncbi:Ahc2p SCDLUD_003758 [Saccharomycodes ludwigii]|uniref:Ahc2p n=1 Tax=Saccharomycodes ludwigii TaxID=36035 RepID=UPI001E8C95F0|nr:hypothetical protein SCDLUD_003758 [Saccharomycodes ludwigii]KAH3900753.1 hypothetical protein SCDLUD_003758 [Saccharomycodes ludwigii]
MTQNNKKTNFEQNENIRQRMLQLQKHNIKEDIDYIMLQHSKNHLEQELDNNKELIKNLDTLYNDISSTNNYDELVNTLKRNKQLLKLIFVEDKLPYTSTSEAVLGIKPLLLDLLNVYGINKDDIISYGSDDI